MLDKLKPADFAPNQQARYWQAQIVASQGRPSLTLLRALIAQEPLLAAKDKQKKYRRHLAGALRHDAGSGQDVSYQR
ncbi:LppC putative lipoprotein [Salmonella enterica subsp. enterica]|uniref:LppC putative lipoprotein n=1 Tax=Salmonella enterica I TaxID=59201 RepID=A0A379VJA1_SALET|nr:LppC putative lipoprotein [Salmonella enterica subsp. enterica]